MCHQVLPLQELFHSPPPGEQMLVWLSRKAQVPRRKATRVTKCGKHLSPDRNVDEGWTSQYNQQKNNSYLT